MKTQSASTTLTGLFLFASILVFSSCSKEKIEPTYKVPNGASSERIVAQKIIFNNPIVDPEPSNEVAPISTNELINGKVHTKIAFDDGTGLEVQRTRNHNVIFNEAKPKNDSPLKTKFPKQFKKELLNSDL